MDYFYKYVVLRNTIIPKLIPYPLNKGLQNWIIFDKKISLNVVLRFVTCGYQNFLSSYLVVILLTQILQIGSPNN